MLSVKLTVFSSIPLPEPDQYLGRKVVWHEKYLGGTEIIKSKVDISNIYVEMWVAQ